ncbi:MAG: Multidrug resistance protein MdtH [bacterium ADurb.Bin270]|nr:MAG: Multidrug resistance protein MdtH [bacterium ADurb.Bin270]
MSEEREQIPQRATFSEALKKTWQETKETFGGVIRAPRALWGLNFADVIVQGLAYFGLLTILGKFLSENVALSDLHAGWIYSFLTGGFTFAMLFLGGVCDRIGVRKALAISILLIAAGFLVLSLSSTLNMDTGLMSPTFYTVLIAIFIMVIGNGMLQPTMYAGVKQFTNEKTSAVGYAMIYGLMNLGAFLAGLISPLVRRSSETTFPPNGIPGVLWVYTALTIVTLVVVMFILTKRTVEKSTLTQISETKEERDAKAAIPKMLTVIMALAAIASFAIYMATKNPLWYVPTGAFALMAIWDFLRKRPDHPFRDSKFTFFIFILIPVQTLFAHQWLTIPYYIDRAFAGTTIGNNFEFFSNINPILIFFLCPMVAVMTSRANVYRMMIVGTLVMALPTFFLAIGPNPAMLLAYIVLMTVGEAMWQPRFLQFAAQIAPKGKTGVYMGVAQFPWFLTKVITGLYSGWFLAKYCPKPELGLALNTETMWFIYGLIALISPLALMLAKKWIGQEMHERATATCTCSEERC